MPATVRRRVQQFVFDRVKQAARTVGVEVKRRRNELDEENVLSQVLADVTVDLVVDVGANAGQYGKLLRRIGYRGQIVSFEPLPAAHAQLRRAAAQDALWTIPNPVALGDEPGEAVLNVAGNSASSSLLPMLDRHIEASANSAYVGAVKVPVKRLDEALPGAMEAHSIFLKVDTQGFEDRVLRGATGLCERIAAIQVEISLAALYARQASSSSLIGQLADMGYSLSYIIPGFYHPTTGRLLQIDGIFLKNQVR